MAVYRKEEKVRQAINWFFNHYSEQESVEPSEKQLAYQESIDALEKQIPMKSGPDELGVTGTRISPCGSCGEEIRTMWEYCPWCGQKILRGSRRKEDNL